MEQDTLRLQIINDENQGCSRAEGLDALKSPRPDVLLEMIYGKHKSSLHSSAVTNNFE